MATAIRIDAITPETCVKMRPHLTPRLNQYIRIGPQGITDRQRVFLLLEDTPDILFGGAAGGGKSWSLLAAALQFVHVPHYAAIILRRTYRDLSLPGALMDRAHEWLAGTDARWDTANASWRFPSGASLSFGYLDSENDKYRYQGAEFQFIGIDEATQLTESQIRYMYSRLRRTRDIDCPLRFRLASNPGGTSHEFIKQRYVLHRGSDRLFIPARLADNPYLEFASYVKSLDQLDPITRRQLLEGDWTARADGEFFKREWFQTVEAAPRGIFSVMRAWDLAASRDGKRTSGVKLGKHLDGDVYVLHVVKGKWTPGARDGVIKDTALSDGSMVKQIVEQEPGSGGIAQIDTLVKLIPGRRVIGATVTGHKTVRAGPVASFAERGFIKLVRGEWNFDFLDELEAFRDGAEYCDQVDALSLGFEHISHVKPPMPGATAIDNESSRVLDGYGPKSPMDWSALGLR